MSIIKFFAFLIVLITPFVLQKAHTMSPAELAKQINVSLLILGLFVAWVIATTRQKTTVIKWSKPLTLLALWLGANTLSYFFSISQYISFWGDKNLPSDSLQTIIIFFILAFILTQLFNGEKDYKRLAVVIFLTLAGQVLIGFIQRYNLYEHWYSIGQVFGTMGITVAFANIIAAFFPVLLNSIFRTENFLKLCLYYTLIVLGAIGMLYSSSRTPIAAALFILVAISAYELYISFDRSKVKKIMFVCISIAFSFLFFKHDMPDAELKHKMQPRLLTKAFSSRGLIWQSAIRAWQDRPIVGVGPEAYIISQRLYQTPAVNEYEYWDSEWTKVHNQLLQTLVCTGVVGLIVQLLILGYLLYYTLRSILKKQNDSNGHWMRTFSMIYFVIFISNLTCFNFMTTQMYAYLALALFGLTQGSAALKTWSWQMSPRLRYLLAGLLLIPSLALAHATYAYGEADIYHQLGVAEVNNDANTNGAVEQYFKALTYDDSDPFLYCQISYAVGQMLINNHFVGKTYNTPENNKTYKKRIAVLSAEEQLKAFKQMTEFVDLCIQKSDGKYHYYLLKAELYYRLYTNDLIDRKTATDAYIDLVTKFPNNPENYYKLGLIAYKEKEFDQYVTYVTKAMNLKNDYLTAYGDLLNYYYNNREFDKIPPIVERIEKIEFKNPQFVPTLIRLADLAQKNGDLISKNVFLRKYSENKYLLNK